jgi:hypothetical protein
MKEPNDKASPTKTLKTVRVNVKRKLETIAAEVFEHELPILRAMHLYENVNVSDPDYGELTVPDDADLELRRLQAKYDHKNLIVVARVYRNAEEVAKASGLSVQHGRAQRAPASGMRGTLRGDKKARAAA